MWSINRFATTDVPSRSIPPDDSTGFLQLSIGTNEFAAHEPHVFKFIKRSNQLIDPTFLYDCVVVQQQNELAPCSPNTLINRIDKSRIRLVAQNPQIGNRREPRRGLIRRRIINDDDFVASPIRGNSNGFQTLERRGNLVFANYIGVV